jgi:pilus assembly protein CpaF
MRADALVEVRRGLHERLLRRVDARGLEEVSRTERRLLVREEALAILREERHILPRGVLTKVINEVSDAVVGLGPIEFLLKDPEVTEVMVNGPDDVYVERKGRIEKVRLRYFPNRRRRRRRLNTKSRPSSTTRSATPTGQLTPLISQPSRRVFTR